MAGSVAQIGVEAVVKGLTSFLSDLGKIDDGLKKVGGSGNIISAAFSGIGNVLGGLGREVLNVAEYALGHLLADAIQWVTGQMGELIQSTIAAGSEFQTLELRLDRLNTNSIVQQVGNYTAAQQIAKEATQDQLQWIQKLAATTPYDFQDIANVYTLARSYGFAADAAKGLTSDISDFAAGMGLSNQEIERIIVNFGQMTQQGKVTQREMNDLARGAFVPVNDVMQKMRENVSQLSTEDLTKLSESTGISVNALQHLAENTDDADAAFAKLRSTGEGVQFFMEAFSDLVEERFGGASVAMARTFEGATNNAKDFVKSIVGFGVVKPILDVVGGKIADVLDELTSPATFASLNLSVGRLGDAFKGLVTDLLGLESVDTSSIVNGILQSVNRLTSWINDNKGDIISFFQTAGQKLGEWWDMLKKGDIKGIFQDIASGIKDALFGQAPGKGGGILSMLGFSPETVTNIGQIAANITSALDTIRGWVDTNGPLISTFFSTLGTIFGDVFSNITGQAAGGGLTGVLDGIKSFMQFVIDNQETITVWATNLTKVFLAFQILAFIIGVVLAVLSPFIGIILAVVGAIGVLSVVFAVLSSPVFLVVAAVAALAAMFVTAWNFGQQLGVVIVAVMHQIEAIAKQATSGMMADFTAMITSVIAAFRSGDWIGIGKAIITGIAAGISNTAAFLVNVINTVVASAVAAAKSALGIESPSKVFADIGENTMKGMTLGIEKMAGMTADAMAGAMNQVMAPAVSMSYAMAQAPVMSTQYSNTNNFNLTVNSAASVAQVVTDYNTMQALVGAS